MNIASLINLLRSTRIDPFVEKNAQQQLETALTNAGFNFSREHHLSATDIADFLVLLDGESIVVELKGKVKNRKAVYRQLERYTEHSDVSSIILLTASSMRLPAQINSKPAYVVSIGEGWL